jgi:hypothetical protein
VSRPITLVNVGRRAVVFKAQGEGSGRANLGGGRVQLLPVVLLVLIY